jgi:superoxide dismutase, Cu-Zn family
MKRSTVQWCVMAAALGLAGCQSYQTGEPQARATLESKSGSSVAGQIDFAERGDRVRVTAKVSGLKPNSQHGFHVHEKGDCSSADGMSTAGHFNPDGHPHSHPGQGKRHTGDMDNLVANDKGEASVSFDIDTMRLNQDKYGIISRAVIVHANPDDFSSQPTGNAGGRIACGVIKKL